MTLARIIQMCAILALAWVPLVQPALAQDAQLRAAVELYEQRAYDEALAELQRIDPRGLSRSAQHNLEQYTELALLAVDGRRQADGDLQRAETALTEGKFSLAKELVARVTGNHYAADMTLTSADDVLARVAQAERQQVQFGNGLNGARIMQRQHIDVGHLSVDEHLVSGQNAIDQGEFDLARAHYRRVLEEVPGHPDAVSALERIAKFTLVEEGADGDSILGELQQRRSILWQRTVASFRAAQQEVHDLVGENRFKEANQKLLFAREALEAGRQYAEPLDVYESLRAEYEALAQSVADQDKFFNERQAEELRADLERREAERQFQAESALQQEIAQLMEQADQRVADQDFSGAAKVLRTILQLDPRNVEAQWQMQQLEDVALVRRQGNIDDLKEQKMREMLMQAEEAKIPWFEEVNYPDDWLEKLRTPWRQTPGEFDLESEDIDFESSFLSRIPEISFNDAPFDEALNQLATYGNDMNIVPNWPDLATVGVSRDTPVTLRLKDVTVQQALQETLDQIAGTTTAQTIDYSVRNGLVKIATQDFLDRETIVRVYPVQDLVHPIANQGDAPQMDLAAATNNAYRNARRLSDPLFSNREGRDPLEAEEDNNLGEVERLVDLIVAQVRPQSWKSSGGAHCTIQARPDGNIVVTQTALGHQEIFNLLDQLREDRAVQISIEARFLTVSNNFLEDMGIDLDIVLNNGNAGFDRQAGGAPGSFAIDPSTGGALLLPRNFSRLGFAPAVPGGLGVATNVGPNGVQQPFTNVAFVPANNGNGNSFTPIPLQNNASEYTTRLQSDVPGSFAGNGLPPALQIAGSFLDNIQVDFLIRATQADSRASTMLAPKLILTNGQQAWIAITNQQNFVSTLQPVVASGAAAQQPITQTIDTGAVLNVQAVASPDRRYVTMNLQPGVGRLIAINEFRFSDAPVSGVGAGGFVQLPVVQRQQVKTTVTVPDGGTLLVGGQKTTTEHEIEAGVPVLSKIPVLKRLYSSRAMVKDEQILLILIKPKVLIQEEQEEVANPTLSSLR